MRRNESEPYEVRVVKIIGSVKTTGREVNCATMEVLARRPPTPPPPPPFHVDMARTASNAQNSIAAVSMMAATVAA